MNIETIMSKQVVTVDMDDSLKVVKEIFDNTRFHHLLVVENGKLYGIISDRDVLKSISPFVGTPAETTRDIATLNKRAHQIMTRKPITITANADIRDAVRIFYNNKISCIPVVDEHQHPVGIISWRDLLKQLSTLVKDI